MTLPTVAPGVLTVGAALPDPPFGLDGDPPAGLDIELTQALAEDLGLGWRLVRYEGGDFNGIFAGLGRRFDVAASGVTVTPPRETVAQFLTPYLVTGQALACNPALTPRLHSTDGLTGMTLGVQEGNTSEPVAEGLKAEGRLGAIAVYPYGTLGTMLDDLKAGKIQAVMQVAPILAWFLRDRPGLKIVEAGITEESIALAVAAGAGELASALDDAQARLEESGALETIRRRWLKP